MIANDVIERYHQLLMSTHARTTCEGLALATREEDLTFHGVPLCSVLRPHFVDAERLRAFDRAAALVMRGLNTVTRAAIADPALRGELRLGPEEAAWLENDSAEPKELVGRLDGFVDSSHSSRIAFIEYNARPASLFEHNRMPSVFARLPIMKELAESFHFERFSFEGAFDDALRRLAKRFGASEQHPTMTILGEAADSLSSNTVARIAAASAPNDLEDRASRDARDGRFLERAPSLVWMLRAAQWNVEPARHSELEVREDGVFARGKKVGPVYFGNWELLPQRLPLDNPFWHFVRSGDIWPLNAPASKIIRSNKCAFAWLSEPRFERLFEADVARGLREHVPWTRIVRSGQTRWRNQEVDLLHVISEHRAHFALKPSSSHGGIGVTLGWACDDAAWASALERALRAPHVVQERVSEGRGYFPRIENGKIEIREHLTDLNCYVWGTDTPAGHMTRVSRGPLMNMTAGAGTTTPVIAVCRPKG